MALAYTIDSSGITVPTQAQLLAFYTAAFQAIFGSDINLDQDSPDGQLINILDQVDLDLQDLLIQINSMFDPDQAVGTILDQRVSINGIQRQAGTFTTTPVTVVVSQAMNLYGLDQTSNQVFTVADNAGNNWELISTVSISAPGSYSYEFESAVPGAVLTVPNTITIPVTIVLGVTSVNNPSVYTTLGVDEESDAALKIRRQKSVAAPSQGVQAGLLANLENIAGVTAAFVYENDADLPDGDGVPGHSIWVIVSGTGAVADIAQTIYNDRNLGCGMFGAIEYSITQVDGSMFIVRWDDVVAENLFIKFTASSLDGINPPNIAGIVAQLPGLFVPGVNAQVNINELGTFVQDIDSNTLVTGAGFSTTAGGAYTNTLSPTTKKNQFLVSTPNIIVLPMILNPVSSFVAHAATEQFTALGGYGSLTYSILVNNSGGSINGSGLYTAGGTFPVVDTVKVQDSLGNIATATVNVT